MAKLASYRHPIFFRLTYSFRSAAPRTKSAGLFYNFADTAVSFFLIADSHNGGNPIFSFCLSSSALVDGGASNFTACSRSGTHTDLWIRIDDGFNAPREFNTNQTGDGQFAHEV